MLIPECFIILFYLFFFARAADLVLTYIYLFLQSNPLFSEVCKIRLTLISVEEKRPLLSVCILYSWYSKEDSYGLSGISVLDSQLSL